MVYRHSRKLYKAIFILFSFQLFLTSLVPFVYATDVGVTLLETPVSIQVTPNPVSVNVGVTQQFTAVAQFAGGSTLNVTSNSLTTWDSTTPAVATVNATGLATTVTQGTTNIRATYGGVSGQAALTVTTPTTAPGPTGGTTAGGTGAPSPSGGEEPGGEELPGEETRPGEEAPSEEPGAEEPREEPGPEEGREEALPPSEEFTPPGEESLPPAPPPLPSPPPPGAEEFAPEMESPEFQFVSPLVIEEVGHAILENIFLPDELSVTRGEIMQQMNEKFKLDQTYNDQVQHCVTNIHECLSIFLSVTNFTGVVLDASLVQRFKVKRVADLLFVPAHAQFLFDFGKLQLYPDVPPDNPYSYVVNLFTILSVVQGYYGEADSPFKSYQIITRIEATKVLLGSVGLMKWMYYPELEATLGGADGVTAQKTPFNDINPTRDYMWWYPRYVNVGCEVGMLDCSPGSSFRPDEFITESEMGGMMVKLDEYLEGSQYMKDINGDDDEDLLKNYIERGVTYTNPQKKDTDDDDLTDSEEINTFNTSPFLKDSDAEGLSDYDEVMIYKTDPLSIDTDLDDFTDFSEIQAGTDPLDADSFPIDADGNGVRDDWEEEFKIKVNNGIQDTDKDGVSDKLEYQYGTNPNSHDSDGDGLTDAEEILEYRSDPLDPDDPGDLDSLGVRITNFQENQLVGDTTPLIKGVAPLGSTVRILLRNDYGHEKVLGSTEVDENNVFIFQTPTPLRDGRYMIVARSLQVDKQRIIDSDPVHIVIDSTLNVTQPVPRKLADTDITEDVLLRNLRVTIRDNRPVLSGETEFGNRVTASWRSVVTSSVLIADAITGEFEIQAPREMELGNHEVWVTAVRKKDSAQSETVKVNFSVGTPALGEGILRGVGEEAAKPTGIAALPVIGNIAQFVREQGFLGWLVIAVALFLLGSLVYYFYISRKK